jgi:hypothetical protein
MIVLKFSLSNQELIFRPQKRLSAPFRKIPNDVLIARKNPRFRLRKKADRSSLNFSRHFVTRKPCVKVNVPELRKNSQFCAEMPESGWLFF